MKNYLLSILILLSLQLSAFAQKAVDNSYLEAIDAYTSKDYKAASSLFDKVLSANPSNDAALYYKGMCQMFMGNQDEAVASLAKAAKLDTANYWYRDRLAMAYTTSGQLNLATEEYENLVKAFPKKIDAYYTLVNLYLNQGDMDKAVGAINAIEQYQGKSDGTVMTKYQILLRQKKQQEALETLQDYSKEYSSPQVLAMLGDHETGMSNDSLALAYYDAALELDSSYSPALLGKAELYRMSRKYPEYFGILDTIVADDDIPGGAKADYISQMMQHVDPKFIMSQKAQLDTTVSIMLDHHPADTLVLQTAGIYYYNTGRQDEARKIFKANVDANPDNFGAMEYYLQVLSSVKDYDTLIKESEAASKKFPGKGNFDQLVLFAEYNQQHYDKVIAKCEEMLRKAPADSAVCLDAYSTMGDMYHLLGDSAKAYKVYDKALKINPNYAPVLNNYAYYLSVEGKKLGKAYKMSKKTIEQEPDNATYLDTFGWILHLQGKDLEAKPFFKHAMLYGGKDSATMLAHYALVLESLGENDLAEVYKKQAKQKAAEGAE